MKKLFLIIATITTLSSCAYHLPLDTVFTSPEEINAWVYREIQYRYDWQADNPALERWQSPKETLESGYGDCEDQALLFMFLCNRDLGIKPDLLLILVNGEINMGHYIARIGDIYYDPTNNLYGEKLPYTIPVMTVFEYDLAMTWATKFYTRSLR